jgi:hypothetical protein
MSVEMPSIDCYIERLNGEFPDEKVDMVALEKAHNYVSKVWEGIIYFAAVSDKNISDNEVKKRDDAVISLYLLHSIPKKLKT